MMPSLFVCRFFGLLLCIVALTGCQSHPKTGGSVGHYDVHLTPDFAQKLVDGVVAIGLDLASLPENQLTLDADGLQIDSAVLKGGNGLTTPVKFEHQGKRLKLSLVPPLPSTPLVTLEIKYRARAATGLVFSSDIPQVFTAFSTSQWMPCIDSPSARATLTLTLTVPENLKTIGNGTQRKLSAAAAQTQTVQWSLDQPMPSYLFGFAVGDYLQVTDIQPHKTTLHYFAPKSFTQAQLQQIFVETRSAIAFYEDKAGIQYPFEQYTQVLVKGSAAQEMSSYSIMGERYGQRVLENEKNIWLAIHELSHQWWGNGVTNASWRQMWLNEGIATFMTAAYLEHRFGRGAYLQEVNAAKASYEKIKQAGADKALVFSSWDAPTAQDRSLVYDKGSYFVHLLRELMGETAFWLGLKDFTRAYWGASVTSTDFQATMQRASPVDLSALFDQWVLGK
jgi:aminopeptidase N